MLKGLPALAGIGLLAGCSSAPGVENTYAQTNSTESIYRTIEKAEKVYRSEQAECVTLFNHAKDRTSFNGNMMHVTLKAGNSIAPTLAKEAQIVYTAKGTGMIKLNNVAIILQEGSGLYIPKGTTVEVLNNSSSELKIMVLCHEVPDLKWNNPEPPLAFQTGSEQVETATAPSNAPTEKKDKKANDKDYDNLVPDVPGNFKQPDIKPETLTPDEKKVNTLLEEGFQK